MSLFGTDRYEPAEAARLQHDLNAEIGEDSVSERVGPGGKPVQYIEVAQALSLANTCFKFNGWSSNIVEITQDFLDEHASGRFSCGCSAIIRVTTRDGTYHEDVGYGSSENQKSKGTAVEFAKKKAVSDGIKRTLRQFGSALGLGVLGKTRKPGAKKGRVPSRPPTTTSFGASRGPPLLSNNVGPSPMQPQPTPQAQNQQPHLAPTPMQANQNQPQPQPHQAQQHQHQNQPHQHQHQQQHNNNQQGNTGFSAGMQRGRAPSPAPHAAHPMAHTTNRPTTPSTVNMNSPSPSPPEPPQTAGRGPAWQMNQQNQTLTPPPGVGGPAHGSTPFLNNKRGLESSAQPMSKRNHTN
eukprot:TRINITY_DN52993_c0_g1_i1.p1 TRINITY_DN52993_c0_g1~~TRINITY_DN52993_c0_g1_i1.p1  ORF type:complete len:351 (+),score=61.61 TRINITY_DN52993_c0_g1_i1:37-1089(+)